jgi:hypothetical protein
MPLKGFVEAVDQFQIRGWAFDSASPHYHVTIEIFLYEYRIGSSTAYLFRDDLKQENLGAGDHAFIVNLDRMLSSEEMSDISITAYAMDGSQQILKRLVQLEAAVLPVTYPIQFKGNTVDTDQHPVFILGAARSGTSAMAQGLLKIKQFSGHQEGHILDLMAHFLVASERFYIEKSDDLKPHKDTSVSLVSHQYVLAALDHLFIKMIRDLHPSGIWLDKTPNPDMIFLAPVFLRIWPNSRFIFMKRRPVENIASRLIKFPTVAFIEHCKEWSLTNSTWLSIRSQLPGAAIEIDQYLLDKQPTVVANALKKFLSLSDEQSLLLCQAFEFDHPERTAISLDRALSISDTGWSDDNIQVFNEICSSLMHEFGYSHNTEYFARGVERDGLIWL